MRPLDKKLFRDLGRMKGQMAAVVMVMMCGLAVMFMARSLIYSLETTRHDYYRDNRFGEVFADLRRAPNSVATRLQRIDGVAELETRVKGSLTLDIPGLSEPADGTILSLPEGREQRLNKLFLRTGRLPEPGSHNEVVISQRVAKAHAFEPGNTVEATLYGHRETLRIVGVALSPEYVFESRPGEFVPDAKRFGIFWMNERELAEALDMDGAFNDVVIDLAPGADSHSVIDELDRILEPYGGRISYDREEHVSARALSDELRNLRALAVIFPSIFLSIASFMTSAALTRVVRLQREQIAQLKAYGYSSIEVGVHYMKFALVIVCTASALGVALGYALGYGVVIVYQKFFQFPHLVFHPNWLAAVAAFAVAAFASFLGVFGAAYAAVRLPPAEAMRPEPPADFRPTVFERIGVHKILPPAFRMALRNMERKPWQAFFTAVGLALATAIPIVPGAMGDGIQYLLDYQWSVAARQDVTVHLIEPGSASAVSSLRHLPGVIDLEAFRTVAARIVNGHVERRVGITGMASEPRLNRLLDSHERPVILPIAGMVLSAKLAEVLELKPGDPIRIEVQEGERPTLNTFLAGTITDYNGVGAYMEVGALNKLLREGGTVSGAHLEVDSYRWEEFLAEAKKTPRIGALAITADAKKSFKETLADMMSTIQGIYFTFAVVVAFGVVYNSSRIALSERGRDFATLRVMGFSHREVAASFVGELAFLTALAIPVGILIGRRLAQFVVDGTSNEMVRMPLILSTRGMATAIVIVILSSGFSFFVVSRRIKNLDLIGVLKARE